MINNKINETNTLLQIKSLFKKVVVLQKFQMKFEVYATKHNDQQCQRQRSSQVTQVEQHAENSFPSECR